MRVIVSYAGVELDTAERWRPTVELCRLPEAKCDVLVLLFARYEPVRERANYLRKEIAKLDNPPRVDPQELAIEDPLSWREVQRALSDLAAKLRRDYGSDEIWISLTTGTRVIQAGLEQLVREGLVTGRLILLVDANDRSLPRPLKRPRLEFLDDLHSLRLFTSSTHADRDAKGSLDFSMAEQEQRDALKELRTIARHSDLPILLTGETGTGKTVLAKEVLWREEISPTRRSGRFMEVNCATLRGDLARSELFGHAKGAFTHALRARDGALASAHGGVLFLDEVAELELDVQAMLLKAIEERRFRPVGSDEERGSDFRIIAATWRDLDQLVREGRFRDDLRTRLCGWVHRVPTLHERPRDIPAQIKAGVHAATRGGAAPVSFEAAARDDFIQYARQRHWPGNLRELRLACQRMSAFALAEAGAGEPFITVRHVAEEIQRLRRSVMTPPDASWFEALNLSKRLSPQKQRALNKPVERQKLLSVINACRKHASLTDAAREAFGPDGNPAHQLTTYLKSWGHLSFKEIHFFENKRGGETPTPPR